MTLFDFLEKLLTGQNLALLGAFLAAGITGLGSAKAVGMVGRTSAGAVVEQPSISGKALVLQVLPATQGIYGFVVAFIIMIKLGTLSGGTLLTTESGAYILMASLPIAIVGYISAIHQAKVAAAGVNLIARRPEQFGKAITSAALVETYAILALLVSALLILFYTPIAA